MKLDNINKTYDGQNFVLQNFSYDFEKGKIYIIKGVSGCGKTSLLNIIGGLDKDYNGKIVEPPDSVGFITQNNMLFSDWTIYENLSFIKNDKKAIYEISTFLGTAHLLDKYPSEISGGERQRICIIRALLSLPDLLLADEPAASLDSKNAKLIALSFEKLRSKERCIIIVTHKNCFDSIADEILQLDYGKLSTVKIVDNNIDHSKNSQIFEPTENGVPLHTLKCLIKKNRHKFNPKNYTILTLLIFLLLCCFSFRSNFEAEYAQIIAQKYPADTLYVGIDTLENLQSKFDVFVYQNYVIKTEKFDIYGLFHEKDSVFSYGDMIIEGNFPQNPQQVLADETYVKSVLKLEKTKQAVGKTIQINNSDYIISGIVPSVTNEEYHEFLFLNLYYQPEEEFNEHSKYPPRIYMPYETISQTSKPLEGNIKMISIQGMYEGRAGNYIKVRKIINEEPFSSLDNKIKKIQGSIDLIFRVLSVITMVIILLSMIFQKNEIEMDYYHRRKEIGGLRLFGISTKKIISFLLAERLINCCMAIVISNIVFAVICYFVHITKNIWLFVPISTLTIIFISIIFYNIFLVLLASRKTLYCDIIKLLR